jgi:hypothetical protein
MEAVGVEPKPSEKDLAWIHVAFGLVAGVAGEDGVLCASRATARNRYEVVAAGSIRVGLLLARVDQLAAIDAVAFEADNERFYFHEASNP